MALIEKKIKAGVRDETQLSVLAKERVAYKAAIPETLENGNFVASGIKKHKMYSQLVEDRIKEQLPELGNETKAKYFVEI